MNTYATWFPRKDSAEDNYIEVVDSFLEGTRRKTAKKCVYKEVPYPSLAKLAKATGVHYGKLARRVRDGVAIEDAMEELLFHREVQ